MENYYLNLTANEQLILNSYKSFVRGLGAYLGEGYEVILHSLAVLDHSVIEIVNGHHSGRKIGAPITDFALAMLAQIQETKDHSAISYFNKNANGVILKSTTIPIAGEENRIIGLVCINFYTNTPISVVLNELTLSDGKLPINLGRTENFTEDVDVLIESTLSDLKDTILNDPGISAQNKNKEIVLALYNKGIFNLKDAVIKVANSLNISKNTVYMHIRNLKSDDVQ